METGCYFAVKNFQKSCFMITRSFFNSVRYNYQITTNFIKIKRAMYKIKGGDPQMRSPVHKGLNSELDRILQFDKLCKMLCGRLYSVWSENYSKPRILTEIFIILKK